MSDWWISADRGQARENRWRKLPPPAVARMYGPENFIAHPSLVDAINTAIYLGQPLLLTGEPGCGKTEVGGYVAWKLGLAEALRFDVKSTTIARDLFYISDTIGRFHAAQERQGDIDPLRFLRFQAFGKAILYANSPSAVQDVLTLSEHPGQQRSVVLIDEIDKAPTDLPNDLLMEIESMQFFIPEISRTIKAEGDMRPIVVITSNSERVLPGPFLRRCVYYDIPFPTTDQLREIVASRIGELVAGSELLREALHVFSWLRRASLQKKPGTAELLAFILALRARGFLPDRGLRQDDRWKEIAGHTLLKSGDDQQQALARFQWDKVG